MNSHDLSNLQQRFLWLISQHGGTEAALAQMFAGLDPLAPTNEALRRALLADLMQDADGKFFYRTEAKAVTQEFFYYRIGTLRVRVLVEDEQGEPAPVDAELYDHKRGLFTRSAGLMQRVNSMDAVKITEAEFYAP